MTWTEIKPSELPKLSGRPQMTGRVETVFGEGDFKAGAVTHVEKPDGTLTEISGDYDVRLTKRSGKSYTFEHPVRSSTVEWGLTVRGANRKKRTFGTDDLESVEVSQPDPGATAAVIVVSSIVVGALLGVVIGVAAE